MLYWKLIPKPSHCIIVFVKGGASGPLICGFPFCGFSYSWPMRKSTDVSTCTQYVILRRRGIPRPQLYSLFFPVWFFAMLERVPRALCTDSKNLPLSHTSQHTALIIIVTVLVTVNLLMCLIYESNLYRRHVCTGGNSTQRTGHSSCLTHPGQP